MTRRGLLALPAAAFAQQRYPSIEEIGAALEAKAKAFPKLVQLSEIGRSNENRPLWMARVTNPAVPDEEKEHVFLTALHTGLERSSAPAILTIMKWLLSADRVATETLKRQIVFCFPMMNPDGYIRGSLANAKNEDIYTGWTTAGPRNPALMPEAVAFQQMLDKYQPEVHADVHGHSMEVAGYAHVESTGRAWSNPTLRPYRMEIARQMDQAAVDAGYGMDQLEEDAERVYGGAADLDPKKFWLGVRTGTGANVAGVAKVYAALYAYAKYHTLALASECAWEQSALVRHQKLFSIGNQIWPGERDAGYPTRTIASNGFHRVCAYGSTAAQRRASRVELWNSQAAFTTAVNNPQVEGKTMFAVATNPEAALWLDSKSLREFVSHIASNPMVNAGAIKKFAESFPTFPSQWGPEAMLLLDRPTLKTDARPQNGLALRLRIPYPKAKLEEVLLNGKPVPQSSVDGYNAWAARGFTHVQFNIPPAKSREQGLFIATLRYQPGEVRMQGVNWR